MRPQLQPKDLIIPDILWIVQNITENNYDFMFWELVQCGMETQEHCEIFLEEMFDLGIEQPFKIPLFIELCDALRDWFIANEEGIDFRRLVGAQCQKSFESNLKPPDCLLASLPAHRKELVKREYKDNIIAVMRCISELLKTRLLASRVLVQSAQELLNTRAEHGGFYGPALEALCVFMELTGPIFDHPEWKYHNVLQEVHSNIYNLSARTDIPAKIRTQLRRVWTLKNNDWKPPAPKQVEKNRWKQRQQRREWQQEQQQQQESRVQQQHDLQEELFGKIEARFGQAGPNAVPGTTPKRAVPKQQGAHRAVPFNMAPNTPPKHNEPKLGGQENQDTGRHGNGLFSSSLPFGALTVKQGFVGVGGANDFRPSFSAV